MQEIPIESPLNSLESPLQSPFNSLENPTLENKASSFHGDNYKELHLDYIRNIEKSPTFLFFSHKVLPADNKPFFSYSQAFSYKSWLFLMKIEANFMRIQGFSLINNNSFKVKFDFDENISGKIALGSLNYRPYLLIPLINGMIFIIDLQSLLNNIENKPLFSIFRLNISTNFLLFLENISDLMKEHEKAWNLVFIANISNGTLRLFEASISSESLFPSNNPEIPENPLFLDFIQEISLFYSGLIGKIKNYSDYYLRNPMDSISASHYFSNFLLFIITRRFQLKIVNINTKTVIFETFLEDFANNNNNSQAKFNNIDNFIKIEILNKHPYLENEENKAFCLMAIAEIDNPLSNFIKILNFSINLKKTNRKAPFIEFSRFSNEDICLSIELINSETIKTPENSSISDFSINEKGLFIAFHDNISLKSRISYVSLRNSGLIRKTVFSRDVIIEEKSLEDEDFEAFADKSLIIERLILENRFSYETFMEFTNFEENLKKKSQIIEKIKTLSNEEIMKLGKSLDSLEKTKNRIKCLYFPDKNKGFPIVFRETSISALKSLDFIEEISENLEYSRIFLRNPLTINHLSFLSLDFPNEFLYKKPFSPQILSSIFLVKLALRISPDLLRLSFEKDNEKALSFSIFLTEHISESLSYRDYGEIRAFSLNFQDLLKSGFSGEEVLSIFLDQMIALTQKNRDFQCQKPQEIDIEDWNSLVLGFFAEDLKFSIRSYAVFCLDLLIFFKVFLQITPEETGNLGFILKIEALAQLSQFLMANSEVLKQIPSSETRAFDIARLWNFDIARLWIYENSKELLGNPSNFFDFSKPNSSEIAISGFAEKIKSFCLYFEGFERIDIDFIPNLLRFCAESLDFLNFDKMKAILGIKNPSIEFLKALLLSKRVENAEIIKENSQKSENSSIKFEKALNYVNSFVNIDFLPEFQDRDLLCLGPWFIYQQVDGKCFSFLYKKVF